jgi:hypothetical protein
VGDTIRAIAARRGHPELVRQIADRNNVRSITTVLRHRPKKKRDLHRIRVPGKLRGDLSFHVLPQDNRPPQITNGYAKFDTLERPLRRGLTVFQGYDPMEMTIPIQFEELIRASKGDEADDYAELTGGALYAPTKKLYIEDDIQLLERMAGRGRFGGNAVGPPPIVHISTTTDGGRVVPLIPANYQGPTKGSGGILWRIKGIEWDDGAIRDKDGTRLRQLATVTVQEHTKVHTASHIVKANHKKPDHGRASSHR